MVLRASSIFSSFPSFSVTFHAYTFCMQETRNKYVIFLCFETYLFWAIGLVWTWRFLNTPISILLFAFYCGLRVVNQSGRLRIAKRIDASSFEVEFNLSFFQYSLSTFELFSRRPLPTQDNAAFTSRKIILSVTTSKIRRVQCYNYVPENYWKASTIHQW